MIKVRRNDIYYQMLLGIIVLLCYSFSFMPLPLCRFSAETKGENHRSMAKDGEANQGVQARQGNRSKSRGGRATV